MINKRNGCWGKILRINLTREEAATQELPEKIYRDFIGGVGLAAKIIADEVPPSVKPLDPENKLIFAAGPFNMIKIPGAGRWSVAAISPQSGLWGEANAGGDFGSKLKRTGFDAIVIEGKAKYPTYLKIDNSAVKFLNANKIWGKDARETNKILKEICGSDYSKVVIGSAGEKMVPIACIESESKKHGGAHAGRTGMGAIMGSKNLKAIVLKGNHPVVVSDEKKVKELIKNVRNTMLNSAFLPSMRENGQPGGLIPYSETGAAPIKNWVQGEWEEGFKKLGTPNYNHVLNVKPKACAFCVMGCKRWVKVEDGSSYDHEGPGPEYETLAMMGSNLLIDDLKKLSYMNDLCNRFGIDTISTGQILAMVFELYELGIIDKNFMDGIEAEWGSADAAIQLIKKIGNCEGIGRELGKGTAYLKKMIGGEEAEEASVEVKGIEISGHDPRAHHSMAVTYATSARGPCHVRGFSKMAEIGVTIPEIGIDESLDPLTSEKKGFIAAKIMDMNTIHNSMVWCLVIPFADIGFQLQVDILNSITGWDMTPSDLIKIGERISNLMHIINLKRGLTREDIKLPKRFRKVSLSEGKIPRKVPEFEKMLDDYFNTRGWDDNAVPKKEKLIELGLEEYI